MYKLIQVRYGNNYEGVVDDVTLNGLILAKRIRQFYRPSESRWVDVDYASIRMKASGYKGPERREFLKNNQEQRPAGLLSRFFKRKPTEKPLTAQDWFERGLALSYNKGNHHEAIEAFALSIQLDPSNARTYLNRGIAYERMDNPHQALEDYSKAIQLLPKDAKAYYMRGILLWRHGKDSEAIADLKKSADLGYKAAIDFLKEKRIAR
jgi:tetratricopeptide (TPR) repeat protein